VQTKGLTGFEWLEAKDGAPEGRLRARFSTFDVVDKDGDVTLRSAFTDGQPVPMVWAHQWDRPVGKGVIRVKSDHALFEGDFFLGTAWGRDAYETVKQMAELQEYSYGYLPLDAEPGTQDGQPVRFLKKLKVFEVSPVLVGAGEGTRTESVKAVDAEADDDHEKFADHLERVLAEVLAVSGRADEIAALRAKEGRPLSAARRRKLTDHREALAALLEGLDELLRETDRAPQDAPKADPALLALVEETRRLQARLGIPLLGEHAHA
jgi:HK97 family phage prohead protease